METPASIARHPIHPMLITIPIGLWVFSLVSDLIVLVSTVEEVKILWFTLAYYTMAGGLFGALAAAIPGLFDFLSLTDRRIRKLAATHMTINLIVVALYAINLWLRTAMPPSFDIGMGLSLLGVALLAISGWIGGEMVHVHRVGVASGGAASAVASNETMRTESATTRLGPT